MADEPVKYHAVNLIVVTNPPTTKDSTAVLTRDCNRIDDDDDVDCIHKNTAILFCIYKLNRLYY